MSDIHKEIFEHFDKLSRERALTNSESITMERAMHMMERIQGQPGQEYTAYEDFVLIRDTINGVGRKFIARKLNRSLDSISARRRLLQEQGRFTLEGLAA